MVFADTTSTGMDDLPMMSDHARRLQVLSRDCWGSGGEVVQIGRSPSLLEAQKTAERFAAAENPILITGETGTGKELFARAVYLLSQRAGRPFLAVNCAQYRGELLASELFGHRRGSFTGAVAEQRGVFEEAGRGVVFLDEVGELSLEAQAMLLRALSEREIVPVGRSRPVRVDIRVIAATSRNLERMVLEGSFRRDLFYRLRNFRLRIPALRERAEDWSLLVHHQLQLLEQGHGGAKFLSAESEHRLRSYWWPGNVRELKSVIEMGYHLSVTASIEPTTFERELECGSGTGTAATLPGGNATPSNLHSAYTRILEREATFWEAIRTPYLDRELSRSEVRSIVARGLDDAGGTYKSLLRHFGLADQDYLRFMDFLRHHRLKPAGARHAGASSSRDPSSGR